MRLSILLTMAALAGCGVFGPVGDRCDKPAPYAGAAEAPLLVVPEGLQAPDTRSALKVPPAGAAQKPADGRCSDRPPSYFPNREPGSG